MLDSLKVLGVGGSTPGVAGFALSRSRLNTRWVPSRNDWPVLSASQRQGQSTASEVKQRISNSHIYAIFMLFLLLPGCTSRVMHSERTGEVVKPYEVISAEWQDNPKFATERTYSPPASIIGGVAYISPSQTNSAPGFSNNGIAQAHDFLKAGARQDLRTALKATRICTTEKSKSDAVLRIQPETGRAQCAALGCNNSIDMLITLRDQKTDAVVWRAVVRTGAVWPAEQTPEIADNFNRTVSELLTETKLVRQRDTCP